MRNIIYLFVILAIYSCSNTTKNNEINENEDALKLEAEKAETAKEIYDPVYNQLNSDELVFVIDYFKQWVVESAKAIESENWSKGGQVESSKDGNFSITLKGEEYGPYVNFSNNHDNIFSIEMQELGHQPKILTNIEAGGGTAEWQGIYLLDILPNKNYHITALEIPCPCSNCGDNPHFEMVGLQKNQITFSMPCFRDDDPNCCPSSNKEVLYEFSNGKLKLVRTIRTISN